MKKMEKEVKNQFKSKNFYLYVFHQIQAGVRPSNICKKLNISKQGLNYYVSYLKREGYIKKVGYGVWEILKEFKVKERRLTDSLSRPTTLQPDTIRGHGFQFTISLPNRVSNWAKREIYLERKGIKFKKLDNVFGGAQIIEFKGRKILLTNKSIIIYEKASYLADTAKQAKSYAIFKLLSLIRSIERYLGIDISFQGQYKFKVSRQHYSLIKNALARQYDQENKKLQCYHLGELWFAIDNSYNLHEAETLNPKSSDLDMDNHVIPFFNGLKQLKGYTPQIMVKAVTQNAENLNNYAVHLKSHVKSIKLLGNGVKRLNKSIKKLDKKL